MSFLKTVRGLTAIIAIVVLGVLALVFDKYAFVRRAAWSVAALIAILAAWHEWNA